MVASDHLDLDALHAAVLDRLRRVVARRVKQRKKAQHLPLSDAVLAVALGLGDAQRAVAAVGKLNHLGVHRVLDLLKIVRLFQHHLRRPLHDAENTAAGLLHNGRGGELVDGVERHKLDRLEALELVGLAVRVVQHHVDRLLGHRVGRQRAIHHHVLVRVAGRREVDARDVDRQLVQRQSARLVGAQDVHAGHLLDRRHARDDRALLGQRGRTQRERHRQHRGHRDWDAADEDDEHVDERGAALLARVARMVVVAKLHRELNDDPDADRDEADAANLGHDLLQVGLVVGRRNERCGTAKEGVGASGVHDRVTLAGLDGRARERDVPRKLFDRQRLAREGGLVNLHRCLFLLCVIRLCQDLNVGRDNVAELDDHNISWYQVDCVDAVELAVTQDLGFGSERCGERLDGRHRDCHLGALGQRVVKLLD
mmetsp:Transcript_6324/g.19569  ORF Transcript_6324/g.19569 Transcript_6324/m.19569 type:complete len:426 (+) Transcript_6324:2041-3318(+)